MLSKKYGNIQTFVFTYIIIVTELYSCWQSIERNIDGDIKAIQNQSTAMSEELSAYCEHEAGIGIFFLFRHFHFTMTWNTFLMEKLVAKWGYQPFSHVVLTQSGVGCDHTFTSIRRKHRITVKEYMKSYISRHIIFNQYFFMVYG
jgi:hypothetical protein